MAAIALLGTGLLGSGMVETLLRRGHQVRVWNRTPARTAAVVALGAIAADSPAEAVRGVERVHLVLAEDAAVDAVIAALRPGLGQGVPILDHSTNLPERVAARCAALWAEGIRYLHAPVFMSPKNARDATGLMLVAGPASEFAAVEAALTPMTGKVWHVGERPDLAAAFKLLGNGALIAMTGAMGDLLAIGDGLGLPPAQVLGLFDEFKPSIGAIGSRVAKAGKAPATFELTMARKDVRLMIQSAGGPGRLVVLPAVAAAMDAAIAGGRGADDFAVFARQDPGR
jgi:3-hydroxyisobutyrate dehydrogenase